LALIERALAINPNSAVALQAGGWVRTCVGDATGALECFARALRISPLDSRIHLFLSGMALGHVMLGQFEEAAGLARKSVDNNPQFIFGHKVLAASLAGMGQLVEARAVAARVMKIDPFYSLSHTRRLYKSGTGIDRYLDGMRKAGFPD
jgi:tetratricopeptide (TPR) repeat protein